MSLGGRYCSICPCCAYVWPFSRFWKRLSDVKAEDITLPDGPGSSGVDKGGDDVITQDVASANMTSPVQVVITEEVVQTEEKVENESSPAVEEELTRPEVTTETESSPPVVEEEPISPEVKTATESSPTVADEDLTVPEDSDDPLAYLVPRTRFTLEELREWYRMFMEQNPDGQMNKDGLQSLFTQVYPQGNAASFAENVFRTYDVNGDGSINFEEFMMGISVTARGTLEEKLEWAFSVYDKDGSGFIDKDEAMDIVKGVQDMHSGAPNPKKAEKMVKKLFRKFDKNIDEQLSKEEFIEGCHRDTTFVNLLEWG